MFLVFLMKKRPILTALKQMILDEIRQSNGIKPPKINFFTIFCKFLPHKGNFTWKVPSKVIYTFYLKHQKYPFCAPIFHPLSETESYAYFITSWLKLVIVWIRILSIACHTFRIPHHISHITHHTLQITLHISSHILLVSQNSPKN